MLNLLRVLLLQLLAIPLALLLGKAALYLGPQALSPKEILLLVGQAVFFYCALHVLLVWPLHQFARRDLSQVKDLNLQTLIYASLVALPLMAFVYLNSNVKSWVDLIEVLLMTLPATLIAAYVYVRNEKPFLFSFFIALPVYLNLYVMSDLMGPFHSRLHYLSDGSYVLLLRFLFLTTAFAYTVFQFKKENERSSDALILLGLSVPLFQGIAPFLKVGMGVKDLQLLPLTEIFWVGILAVGVLARIPLRAADLWARIWSLGLLFYSVFSLTQRVSYSDLQFRELQAFVLYYGSLLFLTAFVFHAPMKNLSSLRSVARQESFKPH